MTYDRTIADRICAQLAESGSLRAVCRLPGMPNRSTVARWIAEDPDFAAKYARAKALGIDNFVEETMEIADQASDPDSVPQAKIRIETRRWLAERMLPKSYGARSALELSGGLDVNKMTDAALLAEFNSLTRKLAEMPPPDDDETVFA